MSSDDTNDDAIDQHAIEKSLKRHKSTQEMSEWRKNALSSPFPSKN